MSFSILMEEVFMEDRKLKLNLDNDDVDVEECEYDLEIIPVELKYMISNKVIANYP